MRGELWMDIRNDYLKGLSISEISRKYNATVVNIKGESYRLKDRKEYMTSRKEITNTLLNN